ncbi:MAG: very short patch repair endonuclease [Bacteroidaceae bacterium]|nr:very short patch repair endonuclease [Bacteroidaceae bacterium]
MTDHHTPEQRHKNMAAIRAKNTKPEIIVRKYLWSHGFRYRLNHPRLPGKPDIVMRKYRICIFINGCFWHGHEGCKYFVMPKSRTDFWQAKITRNQERDKEVKKQLAKMGWHSMTIWECELKTTKRDATLESLQYTLNKIYLQNHQVRKYEIPKDETQMMVAEDNIVLYEKGNSYKDT